MLIPWHCSHKQQRFAACLLALPTHSLLPLSPPLSFAATNSFTLQTLLNWWLEETPFRLAAPTALGADELGKGVRAACLSQKSQKHCVWC